jgi:excisionase family DNA binding protein
MISYSYTSSPAEELLTLKEAKKFLRCSEVFLWQQRKAGKIKAIKLGKKVLIPASAIKEYLINNSELING